MAGSVLIGGPAVGGPGVGGPGAGLGWWGFREGFAAGRLDGERVGSAGGYRAGFAAGCEVGAARLLVGLEHALGGRVSELAPLLPHTAGWSAYRRRTEHSDEPCGAGCRACSRCVRAAAAVANTARYGRADFPGASGAPMTGGWL